MLDFQNHELDPNRVFDGKVRYEHRAIEDGSGKPVEGLYAAWITLDNPEQLNAYTTEMVKDVILAFRRASEARDIVAVVFTGAGDRAFCTGGNTKEYAEYYAGRPDEYRRYMRLFNDMVTTILHCERPVVCRVNGMRIAGGQEIGMACDFTLASDLAVFGQAGPKHGSAPDGGSTDFLPLFVGVERAMQSATLCETWSAHQAVQYGLITEAVPALKVDGEFIPSPMVVTDRMFDEMGRPVYGTLKTGKAKAEGKALLQSGTVDLSLLDEAVSELLTRLLLTMPGCLTRTVESVRKHKLAHWDKNREGSRSWLGLNMLGEAHLGFRAFNEGPRGKREVDFVELRRRLAAGEVWSKAFIDSLIPK
jgi:6-oxo-cyclohex-1-ene-carbonyl-CoA hydrolase